MLGRVVGAAMIVLIVGAGLCLFDLDHTTRGDFCLSVVAVGSGSFLAISLVPKERFYPAPVPAYRLYPSDLPAPPPRA